MIRRAEDDCNILRSSATFGPRCKYLCMGTAGPTSIAWSLQYYAMMIINCLHFILPFTHLNIFKLIVINYKGTRYVDFLKLTLCQLGNVNDQLADHSCDSAVRLPGSYGVFARFLVQSYNAVFPIIWYRARYTGTIRSETYRLHRYVPYKPE